ncbi:hypothetical protein NDU88_007621 [Pleurodeles waltl]|uniref:Uncharacterized protein n=1 Tax=Pleurodeles waltl TaxID=8319 RepID=A0AAV7QPK4_PLEWA|nr:hypothetical protein NDU88_007621 [Pleurodeles waltl]
MLGGRPRHPKTVCATRAGRSENRNPILGLRPHRGLIARSRRKGPLRAPRPLTQSAASPAARLRAAAASPAVWLGRAAAARGATLTGYETDKR